MEKKDYIGLFETKEVKDKNQEDIKNSPLQEMELQEPNNDENNLNNNNTSNLYMIFLFQKISLLTII